MTEQLEKLIEVAYQLKVYFQVASYQLYHYDDGSYVDIRVDKVLDPPTMMRIAGKLEIKLFADEHKIIVRVFEPYE